MTDETMRRLAALDPVDERELPDGHSPQADAVLHRILDEPAVQDVPAVEVGAGSRRRLWPLVPIAAILALGATWLLAQPSESPQWINCYREVALDADRHQLHLDLEAQDPAAACEAAWQDGDLWPEPPPPSLSSCVTDTGVIAVLPGDERSSCPALGWAPLDLEGSALEVAALSAAIRSVHEQHECLTEEEATDVAQGLIEEFELDGWEVQGVPADATGECVTLAVAAWEQRVLLVPLDPLPAP